MRRPGLLADENVYTLLVARLRQDSWDVLTAAEAGLSGATDGAVLERARWEDRLLLTCDRDFSDLRFLPPDAPGILLLRVRDAPLAEFAEQVAEALRSLPDASLEGHLVVFTQTGVRRRPLRLP